MKILITGLFLFLILPMQAFAQLDSTSNIVIPVVANPPNCEVINISGSQGWTPFSIKIFYEATKGGHLDWQKTLPETKPFTQQTDTGLYFFTNSTEPRWLLNATIDWDTAKHRAVYIEYWSQATSSHSDVFVIDGTHFCALYTIATSPPPHIPTAQELLGQKVYEALNDVPLISPAINQNTTAINQALILLAGGIIFALLMAFTNMISAWHNKRMSSKNAKADLERATQQQQLMSDANDTINKMNKIMPELQEKTTSMIESGMSQMTMNWNSFLLEAKKEVKKLLSDSKLETFPDVEPIESVIPIETVKPVEQITMPRPTEKYNEKFGKEDKKEEELLKQQQKFRKIANSMKTDQLKLIIEKIKKKWTPFADSQIMIIQDVLKSRDKKEKNNDDLDTLAREALKTEELISNRPVIRTYDEYKQMSYEDLMKEYVGKQSFQKNNPLDEKNNKDLGTIHELLQAHAKAQEKNKI